MTRIPLAVAILILTASQARAQTDVAREIERLEQQLVTAIEAKDFATYQRLVAEHMARPLESPAP
jgi:hypothetical protein